MNGNLGHTGIMGRHADGRSRSCSRVVLFLTGLMILIAFPAEATVPTSEREALISFYDSTGGQYWHYSYGWLGPVGTECSWDGVYCDPTGTTVIEIYLEENGLSGSLPPEIGDLSGLWFLTLPDNYMLEGSIPPEIGNLANLERIYLPRCSLSGPLPPEIAGLSSLEVVDLTANRLTGPIPAGLGSLPALRHLYLFGNRLDGRIPPELGNLTTLEELSLGGNELTGVVPPELGNLAALEGLNLSYNQLSGAIPTALGNLQSLTKLFFEDNEFTGEIPPELMSIPALETLSLGGNRLGGQLPPSLVLGPNMGNLYLTANKLEGEIPPTLGAFCDNGGILNLSYNALYTDDPTLAAQLDACSGYWQPQGDPPTDLELLDLTATSAIITWTPASEFGLNDGVYEFLAATTSGGPYERITTTAILGSKALDRAVVGPLEPNTTYHIVARSVSYPDTHRNRNTVVSRPSTEFVFTTPSSDTYHVSVTGTDQNNCLSPATPCRSIQTAIDRSVSGDVVAVGPGRFEENLSIDRSLVFRGSTTQPTIIDGLEADSTVFVASDTTVTLHRLQITNGRASTGGGVFNNGAVLFILETEIAGNSATFDGGGIFNDSGLIVVEASAVIDNTAGSDALIASGVDPDGNAIVGFRNSTLSGNTSTDTFSRVLGSSHLMNCTVADNSAGFFGFVLEGDGARAQHTIIAGNHSPACNEQEVVSRGHNLADDDSCFAAENSVEDLVVSDAGLGPLDDHGGPTRTHELLPGSPAIDAGDNDGAPIPDQRGINRPVDGNGDGLAVIDIGALETSGEPAVVFHDGFETGDTSRWSTSGS